MNRLHAHRSVTRLRLGLTVLVALVVAGAVLLPLPSTAHASTALAAPSAPYTVMTEEVSDAGAAGAGPSTVFEPSSSTISATGDNTGVQISATNSTTSDSTAIAIQPPTGQTLAVGTYDALYSADATHAYVSYVHGTSCQISGGTVQIRELTFAPGDGHVTSLAATYQLTCYTRVLSGELRYSSSIGYVAATLTDDGVNWPYLYIGDLTPKRTYTVTSRGSDALAVSTVDVLGTESAAFLLASNTCNGATLAYGETCTIQVVGRPFQEAGHNATLTVHDNEVHGQQGSPLYMYGMYSDKGGYTPITPMRVLDTRIGLGARRAKVGPGGSVTISLPSNHGAVANGITAMALNLTVTGETATRGYITAYAAGSARPTASSLNYVHGVTRANHVIVPVSSTNKVTLYNCCGSVDLIADVEGVFDQAARSDFGSWDYFPARPTRMLDTRDTAHWRYGALKPGYEANIPIDFGAQWRSTTSAFAINVTAVSPSAGGYLTAFSGSADPRHTSTLNYSTHVTTANLAITPVEICHTSGCNGIPQIRVFNGGSKAVHVLVDVVGFFGSRSVEPGLRFTPIAPTRLVDTRIPKGAHAFGPAEQQSVTAPDSLAGYDTYALAANVTAVTPTANTFLTLWPHYTGEARPGVSNINASAGSTVANGVLTEVGPGNVFDIYNSSGTTNVLVDVSGRFDVFPSEDPNPFGATFRGQGRAQGQAQGSAGRPASAARRVPAQPAVRQPAPGVAPLH